jgi:hypothetical protein
MPIPKTVQPEIRLRIVVVDPVPGVVLRAQGGRSDLVAPSRANSKEATFDLTVRVGSPRAGGEPNFLGAFAQGPPSARFIYINAGRQAGQQDTVWDRRAKIPLTTITAEQVADVVAKPQRRLEVQIGGRARDGGPSCATVPLLPPGWRVSRQS